MAQAFVAEPVRMIALPEDRERLRYAPARVEYGFGVEKMIPEMSRATLASVRFGALPPVTGRESHFAGFLRPGTREWAEYFSTRKVVERQMKDGSRVLAVSHNLYDVTKFEEIVTEPAIGVAKVRDVRRYELAQVLTDPYLADKFQFPESFWSTVRAMAVAHPDNAAVRLQAFMRKRPGSEHVVVTAGKYSRSKNWARSSVRAQAARFPTMSAASTAAVIGDKLLIYGSENTVGSWFVSGPLWYGGEVADVFKMVCSAGTSSVMFALGSELTILDIDISNGETFESPSVYCHAGPHSGLPDSPSSATSPLLSSHGRTAISAMASSLDVVMVDGVAVASAVRISPRYVLVPAHIVDMEGLLVVRDSVAQPVRSISKDLWLVRSEVAGEMSWAMRDPEVGEAVIVCYRKGDEVHYTSPMTLRTADGVSLVMSRSDELRPGMSGGAVLALSDLSLLGVYEGVGAQMALASAFTQEHFTDVCTLDHASSVGHSEAEAVEGSTYYKLRQRGLGKVVDSAIASMVPLYVGSEHVGMGYTDVGVLRTTFDVAHSPVAVGETKQSRMFTREDKGFFVAEQVDVTATPMLVRRPQFGESVVVIGRDAQGPYYSSLAARVIHVGLSACNFTINAVDSADALPLAGGLVVALADAAVVGQYVRHSTSLALGEGGFCQSLHMRRRQGGAALEPLDVAIVRIFPMLHPSTWPPEVVEEVFTHMSVQTYSDGRVFNAGCKPLAFIGDAIMRVAAGIVMREAGYPHSRWASEIQASQSNAYLVTVAEKFSLNLLVRTGGGTTLQDHSEFYASVVEALVGAVYLYETADVFNRFCVSIGVIKDVETLISAGADTPKAVDRSTRWSVSSLKAGLEELGVT